MTEEVFWAMNPNKMKPYFKAYEMSAKRRMEETNYMNFIQGRYYVDALLATVGNMFGKKGSTSFEYPEKPYDIFDSEKPKEQTEEEARKQAIEFLNRFAANRGKRVKEI